MYLSHRPSAALEQMAYKDKVQWEKSNLEDHDGFTDLHKACDHGELSVVKDLVRSWSDINKRDSKHGYTPLHVACIKGRRDVVAVLTNPQIKFGDDFEVGYVSEVDRRKYVNKGCKRGRTSLHYACMGPDRQLVIDLLKIGANVHIMDFEGCTALLMASKYNWLLTVETLIHFNADVRTSDNNGLTALHVACMLGRRDLAVLLLKLEKTVRRYIEVGGSVSSDSASAVKDISEESWSCINNRCNKGRTPLHYACRTSNTQLVNDLILRGAEVDKEDNEWYTPLHVACEHGHLSTVEELIKSGADILKRTDNGRTALHITCKFGYRDIAALLLNQYDREDIEDASEDEDDASEDEDDASDVESYVNKRCHKRRTALHYACRGPNTRLVKDLLEHGADLHVEDTYGFTALHMACKYGQLSTVEELIRSGLDLHKKDKSGCTALHIAHKFGHSDLSAFLTKTKNKVEEKREE